jgi:hypothetical protein
MNMTTNNSNHFGANHERRFMVGILLVIMAMVAQLGQANTYITLNDGRLHVFPDDCISSMTTDDNQITITATDGSVYSYPLTDIQSIDNQPTKVLPTITSYKYYSKDNYQLISNATGVIAGDQISASAIGIGKWLTPTFTLSDQNAIVYVDGAEHKSAKSRISFAKDRVYTVGYAGDLILSMTDDGSCWMQPYGRQYTVHVNFPTDSATRVPRIDINTVGGVPISSKKYYLDAEIIIDGAGIFPSMTDSVQVKGRGNTTWSSNPDTKNPYRLKFAEKVKPLGLPKGKSWVLLANKRAGSMLTNAYGMKAASLLGTVASNHIIPVDLYVNGTFKGSYNLTEKVGFSSNSVDIDDETVAALLEFDNHYDEEEGQKFWTSTYSVPVNIKKPDFNDSTTTTFLTLNIIKDRVNSFVKAIIKRENMLDHVDVKSAASYLMLNDYILNYEILQPKSAFCYNENILEDSCKFISGPVWDLDWAFGYSTAHSYYTAKTNVNFYTNLSLNHYKLYYYMRLEPEIARSCYELWNNVMENGLAELCDFCQEYYDYAKPSLAHDGLDPTNYGTQATRAADWLRRRANDLCQAFKYEFAEPGDVNADDSITIEDVTTLIDYLLSGDSTSLSLNGADVDGDSSISIADVTALIDMLLSN